VLTRECPCPGVVIYQSRRGFRYGSESFWLAGFALEEVAAGTALDLGTGSGIIAMLLASQGLSVCGLELRQEWAHCWEKSLRDSEVSARVQLKVHDVASAFSERADLIVSNPPFFAAGDGPASPDPWRAAARTESTATLPLFLKRASQALNAEGRICMVLPRERAEQAEQAATALGLFLRRRCDVGARRVLLSWRREQGPCVRNEFSENSERVKSWYGLFGAAQRA